jgi:hypothetical protein
VGGVERNSTRAFETKALCEMRVTPSACASFGLLEAFENYLALRFTPQGRTCKINYQTVKTANAERKENEQSKCES